MEAEISEKKVVYRLNEIFKNRLSRSFCDGDCQPGDPLMGPKVGLEPGQLLYIFFDIEKEFGISIPQEAVASGAFTTFEGIAALICKQLRAVDSSK